MLTRGRTSGATTAEDINHASTPLLLYWLFGRRSSRSYHCLQLSAFLSRLWIGRRLSRTRMRCITTWECLIGKVFRRVILGKVQRMSKSEENRLGFDERVTLHDRWRPRWRPLSLDACACRGSFFCHRGCLRHCDFIGRWWWNVVHTDTVLYLWLWRQSGFPTLV